LQRLSRGYVTWLLYAVYGCMAFLLNGLGAVLAPLQTELGVKRGDVAFYPSLFALGLVVVGLSGGSLVARIGRRPTLRLSLGGMVLGGLLFAVPGRIPTLLGALLLGLGAALLIQLVPALLAVLHKRSAAAALGEANGVASAASVVAPLAVGAALAVGIGWRIGYLAAPLIALAAAFLPVWRLDVPSTQVLPEGTVSEPGTRLLGRWFDLLVAVSVEFCMIFWAASAMGDWHHATAGQAPALASLFLVGMATGRFLASPITRLLPDTRVVIFTSIGVAGAGFLLFWLAPSLVMSAAGLALTGLGVALLYPTIVSLVVAAWPHSPDRAAARAALASGLAIGIAPFLLGRLSDAIGLRAAYLIVPALLVVLAARTVAGFWRAPG
jgi:fucose permease